MRRWHPPRLAARRALPNDTARPSARRRPSRSAGPRLAHVMAEPFTDGSRTSSGRTNPPTRAVTATPGHRPSQNIHNTIHKGTRDANHAVACASRPDGATRGRTDRKSDCAAARRGRGPADAAKAPSGLASKVIKPGTGKAHPGHDRPGHRALHRLDHRREDVRQLASREARRPRSRSTASSRAGPKACS